MARSPFTLAAAVTAAMPGAEVVGARALTSGGSGRFDSAVASLADKREVVIRVASDDETAAELSAESIALRALTTGAREMLPFTAPEFLGETRVADNRALVTSLVSGFQVDASELPPGRGTAEAIGAAIAALHALPTSVVRGAGLAEHTPVQARAEIRELVDRASATGRVAARLTVRWREAVEADEIWHFESTVTLGGAQADSFIFEDDEDLGPQVSGVIGWHGLAIGDPATDLAWLAAAPDAAPDVHAAYAQKALRSPDGSLVIRARLLAELEFARWLVHGDQSHRPDIVDDAARLLDALAEGIRDDDLIPRRRPAGGGVDEALSALDSVPAHAAADIDTSMQTDAYDPGDFFGVSASSASRPTESHLSESPGAAADADKGDEASHPTMFDPVISDSDDALTPDEIEAQRAARAAFQRWTNSSSE